ncbi:MAG: efflux RND transporter permease subunit [Candidatus Omnitrophica bacterium]|nr:efflux RND transporter permease subunit [Candidatus Omnitrophota bacterium]
MSLAGFSIKKPVTVTMIYLAVILLGVISWFRLPQEFFPPITYPQLSVVTNYSNAAPEEVETLITKLIEEAVGTVKNARRVVSTSREGTSIVTVEFNWGTDMNFAALGMREKIDLIKERLPRDAEEPLVMKFNPFALPIMTLSVSGDRPLNELYEIAKDYLKDRLEKIEGVASCSISGGIEREIQVNVSEGALQASDISLTEIVNALTNSNLNYPAGTTEEEFFEWLIRTMGEFKAVSDINATVVTLDEGEENGSAEKREDESVLKRRRAIKLNDIAVIKDSFKEKTSYSRYNGKENVSIAIQRQAEANTIQTVQKVMKELKRVEEILPANVKVDIVYDQSKFIKNAIGGVADAAWQGGLLAILVLLFFLMNVKDSLIVATTIPISIIGTFCLMYFSGITINMISLGGLAMGVGMLVDGAIVVLENIFRHRDELNENIMKSAEIGTDEMVGAVSASTLTTVAVFLPMVFIVGVAGQIFNELALTVTYSLLVSTIVAFTLIPRLVITGKGTAISHLKVFVIFKSWLKKMSDFYAIILKGFLASRKKGLCIVFLAFLLSLILFLFIGKEFMPKVDEGQFLIKLDMPAGTRLDVTNEIAHRAEQVILGMKYVKTVSTTVGSNKEESTSSSGIEMLQPSQAQIVVSLEPKRKISTDRFIQDLKNKLDSVETEGAEIAYVLSQNVIFSAFQEEGGAPIVIEVKGTDLEKLDAIANSIITEVGKVKGVYNAKSSMKEPAPETKIIVNRDKAALYNLSVYDIARTAQIAVDGFVATKFKEEGREIDVRVRLREADRKNFASIRQLRIISPNGTEVALNAVTELKQGKGPSEIKRIDKERTILVSANVFNRNINDVVEDVSAAIARVNVPSGYPKPKLTGEQEQMKDSFNSLVFVLILSIILVYMVMAAQFESLWQPFLIMFTVPLSIIGVAFALLVTGTTVNVISILGVVILGGVVVNNGIVLIDCMNMLRKDGKNIYDAAVEASAMRLRPVLMTACTTILGLIPLALGLGEGSEMQSPLAITVMGGLTVATFLTLIVIPAIYITTEEFFAKRRIRP